MNQSIIKCKDSNGIVQCPQCKGFHLVKNGFTKTGKQQYCCKTCKKRFLEYYTYHACRQGLNQDIISLTKEGMGIRSTARFLKISATTLLSRIVAIAKSITPPAVPFGKTYEVDEMQTFIKSKDRKIWLIYALDKQTKNIPCFNIGTRTNKSLNVVVKTLRNSQAKRIYTDSLKNYKSLIEKEIHRITNFGTNHIERKNLTLRTHIKRLSRKTLCFTKSFMILACILKIYFWC